MEDNFIWKTATPESQGMSSSALRAARDVLAERGTRTFLVIRHDRIVYEWYAPGYGPRKLHYTASLAKAIVGGTSLMLALNDGRMRVDDPACKYVPEWKEHPSKSRITIRHLATHSSGIQDANQDGVSHDKLPGWMGAFWKRRPDPFTIARDDAPLLFAPGKEFQYSNPGMAMLAYAVTAALKGTKHPDIRTLLRERIYRPIGIRDNEWSIGYGRTYEVAGLPLVANWGGGSFTPRAVARMGRLMMRKGNWQGRQLVRPEWVETCLDYAGTPLPPRAAGEPAPGSGLGWWTNFDGVWPAVPRDAFAGAGAGNQILLVVPSLEMIVVRNGSDLSDGSKGKGRAKGFWGGVEKYLFNPLMKAVVAPPYRPSDVIRSVTFAPVSSIVRKAVGSDNWPITWGDDNHQYTSYGDGWGFVPKTKIKLSLGLAKVIGPPEKFRGVNIRSETGERTGDGRHGAKASGMLMVDGVLYMWVRNTGNSTLAWSPDHGKTWRWEWTFKESFGCPTFLNFGRNYAGARDGFVYVYSQDGPTAYAPYDQVVLARVGKKKIRDRSAYEFFAKLDRSGSPTWTRELAKRGAVFRFPGHCERLDAVYNAGIERYMMTVSYGHGGGWGIFDAPAPWGPWTTAFHTRGWGLGNTHGYRLPSKWISKDGLTMYLVFSGRPTEKVNYDSFCVRKLELEIFPGRQKAAGRPAASRRRRQKPG